MHTTVNEMKYYTIQGERINTPDTAMVVYHLNYGDKFKIGYSSNIKRRIPSISSCNTDDIISVAVIPGDKALEAEIHKKLAGCRIKGEWFRACSQSNEVLNGYPWEIVDLCALQPPPPKTSIPKYEQPPQRERKPKARPKPQKNTNKTRKDTSHTFHYDTQMLIIQLHTKGMSNSQIARKVNAPENIINAVIKHKDQIEDSFLSC